MRRTLIQKLLNRLDGTNERTRQAISDFEGGVKSLRDKLQQEIEASTLEEVNLKINKLRKSIDLNPLMEGLGNLESNFKESVLSIFQDIENKTAELRALSTQGNTETSKRAESLAEEISTLNQTLNSFLLSNRTELNTVNNDLTKLFEQTKTFATKDEVKVLGEEHSKFSKLTVEDLGKLRVDSTKSLEEAKIELINRINNRGGGNANRNIAIAGNYSVLSKYTDINLKPGNNVTFTVVRNETTKYTELTIAATGGSGSVGGVTRNIETISTSQTAGDTAGTDYVYLCSAGLNLTLPTATGNTNMYTIKNISNSSVLVSGTIDDDAGGVIMPVKYTSIDVISNDTDWKIT